MHLILVSTPRDDELRVASILGELRAYAQAMSEPIAVETRIEEAPVNGFEFKPDGPVSTDGLRGMTCGDARANRGATRTRID